MGLKSKFNILAGSVLIAGGVLTGAVFAAEAPEAATQPAQTEQSAKAGEPTAGQKEVLQKLSDLRKSAMEKLQADSKAIVDQAVTEGKITQEQADRLLKHGRSHGPTAFFGKGLNPENLKSRLDEAVKAGKMTREQADKLLERAEKLQDTAAKMREKGFMGRGGKHGFFPGAQFKGLTQEELQARLDKAVEAGKLTREQADKLLERWEQKSSTTEG